MSVQYSRLGAQRSWKCRFGTSSLQGRPYDLPYSIELWDDEDRLVEELIALTGDYRVARAAFDEAVRNRPGRIVTLRQKTRLLADSRKKN